MGVLDELEPKSVFGYFEEISGIPHGSKDTKRISDYLVRFAHEREFKVYQDELNNVIIWKPGSAGRREESPVILQGHMDMVCEKNPGVDIDFSVDGLRLCLENGIISAAGTTLGGDDGIAVAYILAILDSDSISHPPIEAVFTVDEEIGMLGAAGLDMSLLKGRSLINIDSEDEGILLVSCAGGVTATVHIPVKRDEKIGGDIDTEDNASIYCFKVLVDGLIGGHSGVEINKGRANSNCLLGRVLFTLSERTKGRLRLIHLDGGLKDNAIPRMSEAVVAVIPDKGCGETCIFNELTIAAEELNNILRAEYRVTDPDVNITIEKLGCFGKEKTGNDAEAYDCADETVKEVMDEDSTRRVIAALCTLPAGIQNMSSDIEGLVETSLNLGILNTDSDMVNMSYSVRSSVGSRKDWLVDRLEMIAEGLGGYVETEGAYPAWEYKADSKLRDTMAQTFKNMYGHEPQLQAIHAGVECGLFAGALPGLDAISFGPDMKDIHTPRESMDVESVRRTWDYLLEVLKRL